MVYKITNRIRIVTTVMSRVTMTKSYVFTAHIRFTHKRPHRTTYTIIKFTVLMIVHATKGIQSSHAAR